MLYQLSYASTLKPSKNSTRGPGIARGAQKFPASRVPALWKKEFSVTSPITLIPLLFLNLPAET
jgi:hypothetical protein